MEVEMKTDWIFSLMRYQGWDEPKVDLEILDSYKLWMSSWHTGKGKDRDAGLGEKDGVGTGSGAWEPFFMWGPASERCKVSAGKAWAGMTRGRGLRSLVMAENKQRKTRDSGSSLCDTFSWATVVKADHFIHLKAIKMELNFSHLIGYSSYNSVFVQYLHGP